jgi:mannan endo-1,4-beta-mannosidase
MVSRVLLPALAGLLLAGAAAAQNAPPAAFPAPDAMAVQPDPAEFVGRADSALMLQGTPRRFGGIGVTWLGLVQSKDAPPRFPTAFETGDILATIQAMASGYARAVSLGSSAGCAQCLAPAEGEINPAALSQVDTVLQQARNAGVKIIIPLSGGRAACPPGGAPDPVAGLACVFARWHGEDGAAFFTDAAVRADFAAYVTKILNHLNPLTGLAYKDDPTIMAWENCDGCGDGIDPKVLADWTEFLGRTIKQIDTHHLYENGAFAGRLGKQAGDVPAALIGLPSVDIVGDRVMPGLDPQGRGLEDAADAVTRASRVYVIDAYGWTPAQFPTQDGFQDFLAGIVKNRAITGAFVSDLSGHAEQGGYLPSGPGGSRGHGGAVTRRPAALLRHERSAAHSLRQYRPAGNHRRDARQGGVARRGWRHYIQHRAQRGRGGRGLLADRVRSLRDGCAALLAGSGAAGLPRLVPAHSV